MRREFLMLAKPATGSEEISGWFMSEKIDGMRCFWDGGISTGLPISQIPWANVGKGEEAISTGLWSRYGNPIYAPDWFVDALPQCFLDGELHCGRGEFQTTVSVCKRKTPDSEAWKQVSFAVFGCPSIDQVFAAGEIKNPNFERTIDKQACFNFIREFSKNGFRAFTSNKEMLSFPIEIAWLQDWVSDTDPSICYIHPQRELPLDNEEAWSLVHQTQRQIVEGGGEGLILRNPQQEWTPKRVANVLKVKPFSDAEAVVVGATAGRTGKTGRYLGMMGNLIVAYKPESDIIERVEFELSGFNNYERTINDPVLRGWCEDNPGKIMPTEMIIEGALQFDLGEVITFIYRELSKTCVPKDARFLRTRPQE